MERVSAPGQDPSLTVGALLNGTRRSRVREQAESGNGKQTKAKSGLPAPVSGPRAYFITFSCYGAWLHGEAPGSVDCRHNVFGTPVVEPNAGRKLAQRSRMDQPPYELDGPRRGYLLEAIREVCSQRGWWLFAAHVRTTHVHVIVQAGDPPEKVMSDFKAYSSRRLNEAGLDKPGRKRWVHHGSTRYLWKQEDLEGAIGYVLHEQGESMAVYAGPGVTREPDVAQQSRDREGAGTMERVSAPGRDPSLTVGALLKGTRRSRVASSTSGFTMMEIAISLAIIGIALVAIIGVLPIGMNVQQDVRQQTIIGQDANVFMEAIRNGSLGLDDLTNYVYAITNSWTQYGPGGTVVGSGVNGYSYTHALQTGFNYPLVGEPLTNGANIIGLLSTPEYIAAPLTQISGVAGQAIPSVFFGGISNHIVAYCRSISGPAYEKPPQDNPILQGDSFSYRMFVVNAPTPVDTNWFINVWTGGATGPGPLTLPVLYHWTYWNLPSGVSTALAPGSVNSPWQMTPNYTFEQALNLHELRLTFEWPQLPNGNLGTGRQTYQTLIAGQLLYQPVYQPGVSSVYYNPKLYCYQAQTFTNTP